VVGNGLFELDAPVVPDGTALDGATEGVEGLAVTAGDAEAAAGGVSTGADTARQPATIRNVTSPTATRPPT
jgi:hypothetical protein